MGPMSDVLNYLNTINLYCTIETSISGKVRLTLRVSDCACVISIFDIVCVL